MAANGGIISSKLFLIIANYWLMNEAVVNCDLQINILGVIAWWKRCSQRVFGASD